MDLTAIAIVGIVFGVGCSIINSILSYKKEKHKNSTSSSFDQQELESLKERVATLEKIVTDEKYQLNREFDNLK